MVDLKARSLVLIDQLNLRPRQTPFERSRVPRDGWVTDA